MKRGFVAFYVAVLLMIVASAEQASPDYVPPRVQPLAEILWVRPICVETNRYIGWPSVCRLKNGDIIAVFSGDRSYHICPWGKVQMVRSTDDGETWSAPETIASTVLDAKAKSIPATLPRRKGWMFKEWLEACQGGEAATCNFDFAQYITEFTHLGNLAIRTAKPVEFDPVAMKVTNGNDAADALLHARYENGYSLA